MAIEATGKMKYLPGSNITHMWTLVSCRHCTNENDLLIL